jgi:hypothetical protein
VTTNVYISDVNLEIARGAGRSRIIMSKGVRFTTTDKTVQRVLNSYPHVELISSEAEPEPGPVTCGEKTLGAPAPPETLTAAVGAEAVLDAAIAKFGNRKFQREEK